MNHSARKALRLATVGWLLAALTALSWLPSPLHSRSVSVRAPATVAREVAVSLGGLLSGTPRGSLLAAGPGEIRFLRRVRTRPTGLCPGLRFTAFGIGWTAHGPGDVEATVQTGSSLTRLGSPTSISAEDAGPDQGTPDDRSSLRGTDPVWVGDARCVRFALTFSRGSDVSNVRAVFINTLGTAFGGPPVYGTVAAPAPAPAPLAGLLGGTPAEAYAYRPRIITRAGWGADERLRNCGPYYSSAVKMAFVHHTDNDNAYTPGQSPGIMRAIYYYHTKVLGWCDIAYNFLVDKYGQVFEGRFGGMTKPVLPGATRGFNTNSVAVAAIGNFQVARPPAVMLNALDRLLAWRLDVAHVSPFGTAWMKNRADDIKKFKLGQWVRFNHISGHRDANYTDCPGIWLYGAFGSIRSAAYNIGLPKIFGAVESPSHFVSTQGSVKWTAIGSAYMRWTLSVLDVNNNVVIAWGRRGSSFSLSWDGNTRTGDPVPPGTYQVKLQAWNVTGRAREADFNLTIDPIPAPCPSPTGSPSPGPSPSPSPSPSPCPSPTPSPSPSS